MNKSIPRKRPSTSQEVIEVISSDDGTPRRSAKQPKLLHALVDPKNNTRKYPLMTFVKARNSLPLTAKPVQSTTTLVIGSANSATKQTQGISTSASSAVERLAKVDVGTAEEELNRSLARSSLEPILPPTNPDISTTIKKPATKIATQGVNLGERLEDPLAPPGNLRGDKGKTREHGENVGRFFILNSALSIRRVSITDRSHNIRTQEERKWGSELAAC